VVSRYDFWGLKYIGREQALKEWNVLGPAIRLTSVNRGIRLNWDPVPGATGYVIEQRIDSLGQMDFVTLPVPMGAHTFTWTAQGLLPGWLASYRIIPVKGVTQSGPGPEATARVGGTPQTGQPALFGYPHNGSDHMTRLTWTAVANAKQMDLAAAVPTWDRLNWAISATSFDPGYLQPGHWYRFRVIPVNGALFGPVGTGGYPHYRRGELPALLRARGLVLLRARCRQLFGGACYRSNQAWPYMVPESWEPEPTHFACASDTTSELLANQWTRITDFPGTVLITLTIGGNDVGFGPVAMECWRKDCTPQEPSIAARIDAMGPILRDVYHRLRVKAPGADIVVAGYPKLTPPETASCSSIFGNGIPGMPIVADGFRDDEKRMVRRLAARLDGMIQRIGAEEDVVVAVNEVSDWFDGHEACAGAAGEYINQVDCGLLPPGCPGSLHPNAGGQLAYAYAVNQARRRLAEPGDVRY
jgi:hypothetical protein